MIRLTIYALAVLVALAVAGPAQAFDPGLTFQQGTWIATLEGGAGKQNNLENHSVQTGFELWYAGLRASYLFWNPIGSGTFLYGSFEPGLEAIYQQYTHPRDKYYAGLALSGRYQYGSLRRIPAGPRLQRQHVPTESWFRSGHRGRRRILLLQVGA